MQNTITLQRQPVSSIIKSFTMQEQLNHSHEILLLPTNKGIEVIRISETVRIEAVSNYCKLFFSNVKTLVVAKVLRWFEHSLPSLQFIRTHRSHLVNKTMIEKYYAGKLKLRNGDTVEVSRRKKPGFLKELQAAVL